MAAPIRPGRAVRTIVGWLAMALVTALDAFAARFVDVHFDVYIDDITILGVGVEEEEHMGMVVNEMKKLQVDLVLVGGSVCYTAKQLKKKNEAAEQLILAYRTGQRASIATVKALKAWLEVRFQFAWFLLVALLAPQVYPAVHRAGLRLWQRLCGNAGAGLPVD